MNDMAKVIIPKSDQWNFDDFQAGPLTFTIKAVRVKAGQEQPVEMTLEGTPKFYRPCKSMARIFVAAWGADSSKYVGRSVTLYGDPTVRWGGLEVGGIRVSHMSDIDSKITMALTATKSSRKPYTVQPLTKQTVAAQMPETATTGAGHGQPESSASAADPTDDAELLKEVGRRCDEGKFDLAYDLARAIKDEKKLAKVNARIKSLQEEQSNG